MKVVIRVDASSQIGTGHVMRCLTLAKQLKNDGMNVTFIARDLKGNLNEYIRTQFPVKILPKVEVENDLQWTLENWKQDVLETIDVIDDGLIDLLVVDHYSIDDKWEQSMRSLTNKIIVIDDLANRKHDCDLLIDQNYFTDFENRYQYLVPKECILCLGPNYALLRDEFFNAKKISKSFNRTNRILIFFGGSDPTNETERTLGVLKKLKKSHLFKVDVIVGSSNSNKEKIKKICEQEERFSFHEQVSNIAWYMRQADFAIGAGGTTIWERGFLELPSIVISVAENQIEGAKALKKQNAVYYIGHTNYIDFEIIEKAILYFFENKHTFMEMNQNFKTVMDIEKVENRIITSQVIKRIL